ncbi:alpha/beta hydrolase [Oceanospirillum beijerinckii]|uniref:alpha/beta hydrolase n=1 Tax=Oceanospirillum beijerinckii TaxID=64976 RepID=UPI0003FF81FB|nr:alpha/beta fold hydrolase [Oceanospirillum beijerinckii]
MSCTPVPKNPLKTSLVVIFSAALMISACSQQQVLPEKRPSAGLPDYRQTDFQRYIADNKRWLRENRHYLSDDLELEIAINSPFELKPEHPNGKAVLLVHGLSDSPYSFIDIGQELVEQGYLVRTLLLPGHGSKAADLMLPVLDDWTGIVKHHTQLLNRSYDEVWLGGYSTGANLVTIEAIENPQVAGLLLFSPAFKPESGLVRLAPIISYFIDWADEDPEENIAKYESLPMNGAAVYYQTSTLVRDKLKHRSVDIPVFMAISEGDSVIDTKAALELYQKSFKHANNQLVWFGEYRPNVQGLNQFTMRLPEHRVSTGSHMSPLYKPDNAHYGKMGWFRMCSNGQDEVQELLCREGAEVWFSGWGYREEGKTHARLSWNPYFKETMAVMRKVL